MDTPQLIANNLYGPADIFFNMYKKELIIPLLLGNEVIFMPIDFNE